MGATFDENGKRIYYLLIIRKENKVCKGLRTRVQGQ